MMSITSNNGLDEVHSDQSLVDVVLAAFPMIVVTVILSIGVALWIIGRREASARVIRSGIVVTSFGAIFLIGYLAFSASALTWFAD